MASALWSRYSTFAALIITSGLSTFLLYADVQGLVYPGQQFVASKRASWQILVQIVSSLLGIAQVRILCTLINYATRIWFTDIIISLDKLRFWNDIVTPQINWDLPRRYTISLMSFVLFSFVPPALWVGSLTPVATTTMISHNTVKPTYDNSSLIREYPSEDAQGGPTLQMSKGMFTYSVGIQMIGDLLASASTASTNGDGGLRAHRKLDKSLFTYIGRSYGVASSVGLKDDDISNLGNARRYQFYEDGWRTSVSCIYNQSSDFGLRPQGQLWLYSAYGVLPDSQNGPEESTYIGHNNDSIVAIGVAHAASSPGTPGYGVQAMVPRLSKRYIAFAAGKNYAFLDQMQCVLELIPESFHASVDLTARNITVALQPDGRRFGNNYDLTHTLVRQFELIANDETNLYRSVVGGAFNKSVSEYRNIQNALNHHPSDEETNLRGVENALTAMADDMLVAYASAQLMIGNFSISTAANVEVAVLRFGARPYIIAGFIFNAILLLTVLWEALRTRSWALLPVTDYADLRHVVHASSAGGFTIAERVYEVQEQRAKNIEATSIIGRVSVKLGSRHQVGPIMAV